MLFLSKRAILDQQNIWKMKKDSVKFVSTSGTNKLTYQVLIVGGGTGGMTMAARLSSKNNIKNMAIIEPSDVHYYQPYWTLVGGRIVDFQESVRSMTELIPNGVTWLKDSVVAFHPLINAVVTKSGKMIYYNFLIVAVGLKLSFDKIDGLSEALHTPGVCSNYSPFTVEKTAAALKDFKCGNAIFTQPAAPIKCAGAPQKIAYLADDYFRKTGKRNDANIMFCTAMDSIFSVEEYAKALYEVANDKNITVHTNCNLVEVKPQSKEAVFLVSKNKDKSLKDFVSIKYEMLHVTPPMFPADPLKECEDLSDSTGYLSLHKHTLQHTRFPNVFGIGDCTNLPTSKTAAAIAGQCGILTENILAAMSGQPLQSSYNGYTSCPLVTGNKKGILAEFDYNLKPFETFPFSQHKERYISYFVKKNVLPFVYWKMMLKGYWKGPGMIRKLLRFGR